ncbi:general stress protein 26 [Aliiruegeria haliotis]|uniref:General stress protein 26 n=1 Tax=Aliiruegeria haliotis TaxID=1280846 RepID=A0A2T0RPL5_9RHOB|nr:pyridoxamine 5'-phosphate oxidase family protein [Aliiruegeria haliotis]PRY23134.1 general stress protein 26 [Aliiruegeria haliotis]
MPDLDTAREAPEKLVFDALDDTRAGMLWVPASGQHPQPMTHHLERSDGELWFIVNRQSDLVAAVGEGADARFTLVTKAQDVHISFTGALMQVDNPERLRNLWSPVSAAFFEGEAPTESDAILLRMTLREAALWASPSNPVVFGINVLRANAGGSAEDLGFHTVIQIAA